MPRYGAIYEPVVFDETNPERIGLSSTVASLARMGLEHALGYDTLSSVPTINGDAEALTATEEAYYTLRRESSRVFDENETLVGHPLWIPRHLAGEILKHLDTGVQQRLLLWANNEKLRTLALREEITAKVAKQTLTTYMQDQEGTGQN